MQAIARAADMTGRCAMVAEAGAVVSCRRS
jgi:hypothetical protein